MTQQFKFGDRVRRKNFPELNHQHFITVEFKTHSDGYPEITIISELGLVSKVPAECFELVPHPDTVRLDWLIKRNFDFQKCYDMGGRWWYEDNSFDEIEGTEGMTEREAIDMAMQMDKENTGTQEKDA